MTIEVREEGIEIIRIMKKMKGRIILLKWADKKKMNEKMRWDRKEKKKERDKDRKDKYKSKKIENSDRRRDSNNLNKEKSPQTFEKTEKVGEESGKKIITIEIIKNRTINTIKLNQK